MNPAEKPIGYWLKCLDRLIEDGIDGVLRDEGLSRRHWQLMNLLRTNPADPAAIAESMRPFWGEGEVGLDDVVRGLTRRGWARRGNDGRLELTLQGETAHGEITAKVQPVRDALTDGITTEEYVAVVDTLRHMADNLAKVGGAFSHASGPRQSVAQHRAEHS